MNYPFELLNVLPDFFIITTLSLCIFLGCYLCVSLLHLHKRLILLGIGLLLFLFSVSRILPATLRSPLQIRENFALAGSMLGLVSFVSAIYACCQWVAHKGYLLLKKKVRFRWGGTLRSLFLFFRTYHQFFGWAVLITATLHLFFYLPLLVRLPLHAMLLQPAVLTGFIAWGVLAALVGAGLWLENAIKQRKLPQKMRLFHLVSALFFFLFTLIHIGTKLTMK